MDDVELDAPAVEPAEDAAAALGPQVEREQVARGGHGGGPGGRVVVSAAVMVCATAAGWGMLLVITLGSAFPAVWRLMKRQPRELLAAVKG